MKISLYSVFTMLGLASADYVHDLDNEAHLADISSTGLTLTEQDPEIYLKVTSNNGSTGYTWIIDHDGCDDVVDIDAGYVYYPPEDENSFDVGYGEEIFTLTAEGKGECNFRIAYARAWEFSSFEDYENQNGLIISVPVRVPFGEPAG